VTERQQSQQWERQAHRQLTAHARQAAKTMRRLEGTALVWVDAVRQCVEDRMGIGPDDLRALDDPIYTAALDRWAQLRQLADQAEQLVQDLRASRSSVRPAEAQQEAER
jgi:crotonobetainyl-CoA:carnitine CoA-transferase CaiB-like acyl-CoA transferase